MINEGTLEHAHRHSISHRVEIAASTRCGCFHCLAKIAPGLIREWCDDGQTALCPNCGIDALIGDAAGFPLDQSSLRRMNAHWFGRTCGSEDAG
jgi:hypothetical protein